MLATLVSCSYLCEVSQGERGREDGKEREKEAKQAEEQRESEGKHLDELG